MEQPSVELRFQNLHIETSLYSESGRNLPTIFNAYRNAFEVRNCRMLQYSRDRCTTRCARGTGADSWCIRLALRRQSRVRTSVGCSNLIAVLFAGMQYAFIKARLLRPEKRKMAILNDVSSVVKPGRTTLLLGPPAAGKSTLLKALAGKLGHEGGLKVSRFVPFVLPNSDAAGPTCRSLACFKRCLASSVSSDKVPTADQRRRDVQRADVCGVHPGAHVGVR